MERNDNQFAQKQNKGFNVFIGETYVGHMVINEDRVDPKVVAELQKPEKMRQILANAKLDLRVFIPKELREKRDTSALTDILNAETPAEGSVDASDESSPEMGETVPAEA